MPTISSFFGIRIRMYADDHNPPHFHAAYQGYNASYDFEGNRRDGDMPRKQEKFISVWAMIHTDDLQVAWDMAHDDEQPFKIDPLR